MYISVQVALALTRAILLARSYVKGRGKGEMDLYSNKSERKGVLCMTLSLISLRP